MIVDIDVSGDVAFVTSTAVDAGVVVLEALVGGSFADVVAKTVDAASDALLPHELKTKPQTNANALPVAAHRSTDLTARD